MGSCQLGLTTWGVETNLIISFFVHQQITRGVIKYNIYCFCSCTEHYAMWTTLKYLATTKENCMDLFLSSHLNSLIIVVRCITYCTKSERTRVPKFCAEIELFKLDYMSKKHFKILFCSKVTCRISLKNLKKCVRGSLHPNLRYLKAALLRAYVSFTI